MQDKTLKKIEKIQNDTNAKIKKGKAAKVKRKIIKEKGKEKSQFNTKEI